MEQKATVAFDGQKGTLVISGELLPDTPIVHHILAALLNEDDPPKTEVDFKQVNNVFTYSLTFTHDADVLALGKAEHDLHVAAANAKMPVEDYRAMLIANAKAKAQADAKAAKEAAKAAKE
jgi:hypothetical protein